MPKNDGTATWYGFTLYPAASIVLTMHQYVFGAMNGDVHWMATAASGASFLFRSLKNRDVYSLPSEKLCGSGKSMMTTSYGSSLSSFCTQIYASTFSTLTRSSR